MRFDYSLLSALALGVAPLASHAFVSPRPVVVRTVVRVLVWIWSRCCARLWRLKTNERRRQIENGLVYSKATIVQCCFEIHAFTGPFYCSFHIFSHSRTCLLDYIILCCLYLSTGIETGPEPVLHLVLGIQHSVGGTEIVHDFADSA